jgi:hypothetical protein
LLFFFFFFFSRFQTNLVIDRQSVVISLSPKNSSGGFASVLNIICEGEQTVRLFPSSSSSSTRNSVGLSVALFSAQLVSDELILFIEKNSSDNNNNTIVYLARVALPSVDNKRVQPKKLLIYNRMPFHSDSSHQSQDNNNIECLKQFQIIVCGTTPEDEEEGNNGSNAAAAARFSLFVAKFSLFDIQFRECSLPLSLDSEIHTQGLSLQEIEFARIVEKLPLRLREPELEQQQQQQQLEFRMSVSRGVLWIQENPVVGSSRVTIVDLESEMDNDDESTEKAEDDDDEEEDN